MKRIFLLSGIVVIFQVKSFSQDLDKELKYFYAGFISQPSIECHMVSKAYKKDKSLFYNKEVNLTIHNNQYYYDMGDKIYIANKKYLLWVDKTDKRIIVGATDVNEIVKFKKQMAGQMDTMTFKSLGDIVYEGSNNGIRTYKVVNLNHSYIKQANISFDATTNYLKKMEFIFKGSDDFGMSSSYTEFTKINTKPNVSESLFDQSAYIQVKNNVISLTPAYKNYQLTVIDQSLLSNIKR